MKENINTTSKEQITYLCIRETSRYDTDLEDFVDHRKINKVGQTGRGWKDARETEHKQHGASCHIKVIRRGNNESFFIDLEHVLEGDPIPGTKECFYFKTKEIEYAFRFYLFHEHVRNWMNGKVVDAYGKTCKIPIGLVQKIENNFTKYPHNISSWDKGRCIRILDSLFQQFFNYALPILPGRQISKFEQVKLIPYRPSEGFIDTRVNRFIDVNFKGEYYPNKTVRVDLFPCLENNVLCPDKPTEEKDLGSGAVSIDINSPFDIYPCNFSDNVKLLTDEIAKGSYLQNIRVPGGRLGVFFRKPELDPINKEYFPAIIDSSGKIIGVDALSIVTVDCGIRYIGKLVYDIINNFPDVI
jgi:hypothetical protein